MSATSASVIEYLSTFVLLKLALSFKSFPCSCVFSMSILECNLATEKKKLLETANMNVIARTGHGDAFNSYVQQPTSHNVSICSIETYSIVQSL